MLLVGPYPPPHGGISVHVATLHRRLAGAGVRCQVLDIDGVHPPASNGDRPGASQRLALLARLRSLAGRGWAMHLHTHGHTRNGWLMVLSCGVAARRAPGRLLPLHSGRVPDYLESGAGARSLARVALQPYGRIVCVSERIREAVAALGVEPERLEVGAAYLPVAPAPVELPEELAGWLTSHRPLLASTLFFRPEYGFDVLLEAIDAVRRRHPSVGCLVVGGGAGESEARAAVRARGLEEHVRLTGDLPHALCLGLIARAHLFVRPARTDGDALSVREALHLGVPVVASDAALRPPGVVLFPNGDAAALAERVDAVLCMAERAITDGNGGDRRDPLERLIQTYREACDDKESPWAPRSWAS
jgi:glycosyltransferase involved in cell wall biosynthesis